MPELPDLTVYLEHLRENLHAATLLQARVNNPFLLRTVDPPLADCEGRKVEQLRLLGKRIAIGLEGDLWLVLHLMIAGRLQWKPPEATTSRSGIANFTFTTGTLVLTEAGSTKRASLHVVRGGELGEHDPGGIDVLNCTLTEFTASLTLTNRTIKRQLTNPLLFSGIGNAYSDEILHRARISPIQHTQKLTAEEVERVFNATREVMTEWINTLREEFRGKWPKHVTAFRPGMAVHGRYQQPCPVCGSPVQRIVYAENETNYCATCQTGRKVLADRSLSRLLKDDWPRRIEDWE